MALFDINQIFAVKTRFLNILGVCYFLYKK